MDTNGLMPLLDFAGIALGLLLAALLSANRTGNRAANVWLAAYVLALALLSVGDLVEDARWALVLPRLAHATDALIFLVGPCLWLYVRRLTLHATPTGWRLLPHALPAVLCVAALTPFYAQPAAVQQSLVAAELAAGVGRPGPALVLAALQLIAYWAAALRVAQRFAAAVRERYSSVERRTFGWLRLLLAVNLAMWLLWLLGLWVRARWAVWLDVLAVPAGLYLLAFLGLRQPAVFGAGEAVEDSEPARRYARSGLDAAKLARYRERLESVMQTEKPWLENDLTLAQLAERSGITAHHLSQLLNESLQQTFFDYVNSRRIAEVQRCLVDPAYRGQTVLEIALASGFNSKAAFNAAFRQHTGQTPTQFRRQHAPAAS